MRGRGRGVERRQLLLVLLLLLLSCVQRFWGVGFVLFCFVLFATALWGALLPLSLGQRLLFPYLFIFTKAVVVFRRGRVNRLREKGFVWDWCFDLASVQGCAA